MALDEDARFIRKHSQDIIDWIENYSLFDEEEVGLSGLVQLVSDRIENGTRLDIRRYLPKSLPDNEVRRLVQVLTAALIETARKAYPHSAFEEFVQNIRRCMRDSFIKTEISQTTFDFYEALLEDGKSFHDTAWLHPLFKGIVSAIPDIIFVHDLQGNFLYINETGLNILLYTKEELRNGLNIFDILAPEYNATIEANLRTGEQRVPYRVEIFNKKGNRIELEGNSFILQTGEPDNPVYVGIARNKAVERELHERVRLLETQLDFLFRQTPYAMMICNCRGIIIDANPLAAQLVGTKDINSLINLPLFSLVPGSTSLTKEAVQKIINDKQQKRFHLRGNSRFDTPVNAEVVLAPFNPTKGDIILYVFLISRKEGALQQTPTNQSERLDGLGKILAGATHQLKNPMTGILGNLQLAINDPGNTQTPERLRKAYDEVLRCNHILDNLLLFEGACSGEKKTYNLNELIQTAVTLCEHQLKVADIEVILQLEPKFPPQKVVADQFIRVIVEMLENARRALLSIRDRLRKIWITTYLDEEYACIEVRDNGPGIEDTERVFDPFYTTEEQGQSPGLGLSITYGIIREHGGEILTESEPGFGSSFIIRFPFDKIKQSSVDMPINFDPGLD